MKMRERKEKSRLLRAAILTMVRAGKSTQEIVKQTGCAENTVYRVARENDMEAHRDIRKSATGRLRVSKAKNGAIYAYIPAAVLRAANLAAMEYVEYEAADGRIVILAKETVQ